MTSAWAGSAALSVRVTAAELLARIDGQPRVRLGHFPTPLEELPRLSEALGGPRILVKRDDLTGLAFGGNKTRTLEYVLGDLLIRQPEVLVTGANIQSNWSRQAAAGPTQSGLVLGAKAVGWDVAVKGIAPITWAGPSMAARTAESANLAAGILGLRLSVSETEIDTDDRFIGPGYARPSAAGLDAMRIVARREGLLLDPVYTGKAMAALIAAVQQGQLTSKDTVVFLHTGGLPAVFAYRDAILDMATASKGHPAT